MLTQFLVAVGVVAAVFLRPFGPGEPAALLVIGQQTRVAGGLGRIFLSDARGKDRVHCGHHAFAQARLADAVERELEFLRQ